MTSLLALVRAPNLLIAAAGVAIGGFLAQGAVRIDAALLLAMISGMLLGAAGNATNDYFDRDADRVTHADRPLVTGRLHPNTALFVAGISGGLGLLLAYWVGGRLIWLALFALAVMLSYSPVVKSVGLAGNVAVAAIAGMPPLYGALAAGNPRAALVPFALGALLHFPRELIKDVEDMPGDHALGRRTVPLVWGVPAAMYLAAGALILFVPASLAPWFAGMFGIRYGALVVLLNLLIAVPIYRLLSRNGKGTPGICKLAMVWGLVAILWDRL